MLNSVVLPEPLGPIRPTKPPSGTAMWTDFSTRKPAKLCPMSRISRISPAMQFAAALGAIETADRADDALRHDDDHEHQGKAKEDLVEIAQLAQQLGHED